MAKTSQELAASAAGITTEDMGEKVRVHALAKALDIPSAELVQVLTGQGIEGKRATSTLPKAQVGEVLAALVAAGAPAEPKRQEQQEQQEAPEKKSPATHARKAAPEKTPAKKTPAEKTPAKKTPAKKTPAERTTAKKASVEDAPVEVKAPEKAVEKSAGKATGAEKKTPAKRTRKAATKQTVAKKTAPEQTSPTTADPATGQATEPATGQNAQPVGEEKPAKKTTSRRPRRGRKATAAAKAGSATTDEQEIAAGKTGSRVQQTAVSQPAESEESPESTESAVSPSDTVDDLIDRIAGSVEVPEEAPEAEKKPAEDTGKESGKSGKESGKDGAAEAETPRPVRRRVVRRVGSRNAASDAELLRSRRAGQRRVAEAAAETPAEKPAETHTEKPAASADGSGDGASLVESGDETGNRGHRRGRRGRGRGRGDQDRHHESREPQDNRPDQENDDIQEPQPQEPADDHGVPGELPVLTEGAEVVDEPVKLKGSTRLESKKRWRQEQGHDKKKVVSKAEFLARRENVDRAMVVRDSERSDHPGTTTQVGITEDGMLVEHFVTSETQSSIIGNIYLGCVQNVLSSMEAAFIDIGTGRNAVLYAGEVDWRNKHLHTRTRRIEAALKPGDQVLVQVIKDPLGHKGARLTNRLNFAGRYLVYVPGGKTQGISRKLPESERKRLKEILGRVVPDNGGTIIRTAAEGVSEELIAEDVDRLHQRWVDIQDAEERARARKGSHPVTMYEEPNMLVKVIRDIFNEDFNELVVDGEKSWAVVRDYVHRIAPDLESRVVRYHPEQHGGRDVFADRQLDEQLAKALSRKVWLPSGGYLIIDRTEAMTVIDVNTGSFVGSGGNLEETVTLNNLEAAEEIVRQMRLRDMGGMIVVDFIDMVLPENRDLMLRRLSEFLGRDRTRHKVSEVTSLGLVQMTRKRLGTGLLETFSTECPTCGGRGVIIHDDPVEHVEEEDDRHHERRDHGHRAEKRQARDQQETQRRHERHRAAASSGTADQTDHTGGEDEHPETSGHAETAESVESVASVDSVGSVDSVTSRDVHGVGSSQSRGRSRRTRRGSRSGDRAVNRNQEKASGETPVKASAESPEHGADHGDVDAPQRSGRSGETHGQHHGRRRVVRRVEAGQPESQNPGDRHAGRGGDVAAIAAQAVAHAGAEDPDEPTGADYVSDEPEVRPSRSAAQAGTDRRGRRRVRRVVRPAEGRSPVRRAQEKPVRQQPSERSTAEPATGVESSPEHAPTGRSFAEAKAEFDASPRRRRRTRGRSRSDVAPQPADFADRGQSPVSGSTPEPVRGAVPDPSVGPAEGDSAPAPRRGRRRVVRSSR